MKILNAEQTGLVDTYTILNEPVNSIDLMERAAMACVKRISALKRPEDMVIIYCGMGNNGGDGLAIGRILKASGIACVVKLVRHRKNFSTDCELNYNRFKEIHKEILTEINQVSDLSNESWKQPDSIVIDALLGNGINKAAEDLIGEVIQHINNNYTRIISIDLPSGLFPDKSSLNNKNIIRSTLTLSFQLPKLALLMPENSPFVPEFELLDIGLSTDGINNQHTDYYYVTKEDVLSLMEKRKKFSHKGDFGHALLVAGSIGKSGAALIAAEACMRSGAGLLTVHSTRETLIALLNRLPEAMGEMDPNEEFVTEFNYKETFDAIGFGPGLGMEPSTQAVLKQVLQLHNGKLVIDADGLNMLSENKTWLSFLPQDCILTPHPGEYRRLVHIVENDFERLITLKQFSIKNKCIVILKGAHSAIAMPDGTIFFNSSGNAGLAKAGSGDGLTGIILGLLSRGYSAPKAALIGTFIHGYTADVCSETKGLDSILISDIVAALPFVFKHMNP
jgi:ADP-dependent NAD(P)H-hydrate dehydratase / NAD(P)H-hydrate epimerase